MTTIADKLQEVRTRIDAACRAAGRAPAEVSLLAVSKTFPAEAVARAALAGQRAFGENYLQEAVEKMSQLEDAGVSGLEWHCIGPVQANKTRLVAEHFDWLHTLDREKIARRLSEQRPAGLAPLQVCIQVNVDGGANKAGVAPGDALALACAVAALPRLQLRGVMSIPEPAPDFDSQRALHLKARAVFDEIRAADLPGAERFDTLSLGMSGDLEAAVAAGSTLVRVGSALFGQRAARA
ncbi:MAG: YggS family pyridoxal phosphate-dependent enzyme [Burkholderiaceae bacterium]|jgi:pyridoxal phosphate enzyme (YggS family)|nr:YggS family pyridoxal phosphate-dependent enzyme [Burkholderiaceae bacterium]MCO5104140.1 YggS family pyridoxal phosphate-dependent enzyme [Burkholderiaceae bacterium]